MMMHWSDDQHCLACRLSTGTTIIIEHDNGLINELTNKMIIMNK